MASSKLVTYEHNCNKYNERNHAIDTITIHCYVGQVTAKQGTDYLATTERQASVNYVCGTDGIGENIPEKYRAWTSSSQANDSRAVTIETACDTKEPFAVRDDVLQRVIDLCVDICKRNGIKKLVWSDNKDDRVNHRNGCNMTVHRDFASTACPGSYLMSKMSFIANEVNKKLNVTTSNTNTSKEVIDMYRVQCGAYKEKKNAEAMVAKLKSLGIDSFIVEINDNVTPAKTTTSKKSNEEIAREVIQGKWGNGQARKDAITKAGYDYAAVQSIVNRLC